LMPNSAKISGPATIILISLLITSAQPFGAR
jgi:hypothetical protein